MLKFNILFIVFLISGGLVLSGCAGIKEISKGIRGVSTKELDKGRAYAIKRTYSCQYEDCFNKVQEVLNKESCYVYARDFKKRMIAFYVSEYDTTSVGIYFNPSGHATEIEVSSPSSYAKELISEKVFSYFDKSGIIKVK